MPQAPQVIGRTTTGEDAAFFRAGSHFVLVVFGASGDLTRRKLMPALWQLALAGHLPNGFAILGYARTPKDDQQFRREMEQACREARPEKFDEAL